MKGCVSCREATCDQCTVGVAECSDAKVLGQADRKGLTGFADAVKNIDLDAVEFVETEFGSRKAVVNKKVAHEWQQFVEVGCLPPRGACPTKVDFGADSSWLLEL
jgi:hypothetical protein